MKASDLTGKSVSFDHPETPGVRLSGIVIEAKQSGPTPRGKIPDFLVSVRGKSGAVVTVSYVETYMKETP